jgi:hypothetical protein
MYLYTYEMVAENGTIGGHFQRPFHHTPTHTHCRFNSMEALVHLATQHQTRVTSSRVKPFQFNTSSSSLLDFV